MPRRYSPLGATCYAALLLLYAALPSPLPSPKRCSDATLGPLSFCSQAVDPASLHALLHASLDASLDIITTSAILKGADTIYRTKPTSIFKGQSLEYGDKRLSDETSHETSDETECTPPGLCMHPIRSSSALITSAPPLRASAFSYSPSHPDEASCLDEASCVALSKVRGSPY